MASLTSFRLPFCYSFFCHSLYREEIEGVKIIVQKESRGTRRGDAGGYTSSSGKENRGQEAKIQEAVIIVYKE